MAKNDHKKLFLNKYWRKKKFTVVVGFVTTEDFVSI